MHELLVNLKAYRQSTDKNAPHLLQILEDIDDERLSVAVNHVDLRLASRYNLRFHAQGINPHTYGSHTGSIIPETVSKLGAEGTLINHSENQIPQDEIKHCVDRAKEVGIKSIVCVPNVDLIEVVAEKKPDAIAIEPPELIGGDISVSSAKPEVIKNAVDAAKPFDVPVLCGAGVKTEDDVHRAVQLGAQGILVASGVVKAANPEEAVRALLQGFED